MTNTPEEYPKIAFCQMVDMSGSMKDKLIETKIYSKAFVSSALPGDRISVLGFNSSTKPIYPTSNFGLVKVTDGLNQPKQAADELEGLVATGSTNMLAAFKLANQALEPDAGDASKCYVMLTDGAWNTGGDPASFVGKDTPLFVAAIGTYLELNKITALVQLNKKSDMKVSPNSYEMGELLNYIRGELPDASLAMNAIDSVQRTNSFKREFYVAPDSSLVTVSAAWDHLSLEYSDELTKEGQIRFFIVDGSGKVTNHKPSIVNEGSCVFDVSGAQPGMWTLVAEYSAPESTYVTSGAFQIGSRLKIKSLRNVSCPVGDSVMVRPELDSADLLEDVSFKIRVRHPVKSISSLLSEHSERWLDMTADATLIEAGAPEPIAKLEALRKQIIRSEGVDIMDQHAVFEHPHGKPLEMTVSGFWEIWIEATGTCKATGARAVRLAKQCVFAGE